jgi:hypothetical protein
MRMNEMWTDSPDHRPQSLRFLADLKRIRAAAEKEALDRDSCPFNGVRLPPGENHGHLVVVGPWDHDKNAGGSS